jgi:Carboxypeptidase regulatory-like domain
MKRSAWLSLMNPKATRFLVLSAILVLVYSAPLRAQVAGATLSGSVIDASEGAITGARVSVRNVSTNVTVGTTTNTSGFYTVPNLIPADYEVSVSAAGFSTAVSKVTLTVGKQQEMNVSLTVGRLTEKLTVTGAAPQVELATSTLAGNVEAAEIRELPLNGRDWASLATLQPGVASVRTQEQITQLGSHARGLGMQMSIDGNRPTQNTYRLNGIIINDYSNAGPGNVLGGNLGVDAIQEFSVLTSNYSAEYGYTSGGVINAVTRSGTNQFHGSAYEFIRNSALDAANFFENAAGLRKGAFRHNQFGGSAGGPIMKDKIFVFSDYEGLRRSKATPHVSIVPSPEARNGILGDANTGAPLTRFTVDPEIAKYFAFYSPVNAGLIPPKNGATCNQVTVICNTGNFDFSGAQVVPENYYTARGDVKISDKDSYNVSYYYDRSTFTQPDELDVALDQFAVARQGAAMEETHVFSPSMGNTVRAGYSRSYAYGVLTVSAINPAAADSSLGLTPGTFAPFIGVLGLQDMKGGLKGQSVANYFLQNYQLYDDATRTIGTHNLKFGGMMVRLHENLFAPALENGAARFGSVSDFLHNIPSLAQGPPNLAAINPHYNCDWIVAGYFQDDWHMRPSLTLNLGIRYEAATIPTEKYGRIANLATPETNPATGPFNHVYFTHNPTLKNFEPRIGFAWDPFHNGKTSVRAGFGIFDALPLPYELVINNATTSPFHVTVALPGCTTPGQTGCAPQGSFPKGIAPLLTNPPPSTQNWNYVDTTIKRNYIYQWNFNIQRQLAGDTSLTLAYAGSRGIHNPFQLDDINTVFPALTSAGWLFPNPICSSPRATPPPCQGKSGPTIVPGNRINPNTFQIQTTLWQSMSYYNSFQVQVEKRMSHGFEVQGSFTWSKTMDTSSGSFAGDNFAGDVTPTIPWWDLRIVRGLSDFDVERNLVINALWKVRTPGSFAGPAGWIARNWEIGGILTLSDGVPIWPLDGLEGDPMGQLNSEPLAIPDPVGGPGCRSLINPGNPNNYIKTQCLEVAQAPNLRFWNANCDPMPPIGTFGAPTPVAPLRCDNLLGHLGRNSIIGPGLFNFDYSMVKDNHIPRISEAFNIEFRAEFFNILNRPNFAPPVNNLVAFDHAGTPVPGFGQINTTQTPGREIQFALKVIW